MWSFMVTFAWVALLLSLVSGCSAEQGPQQPENGTTFWSDDTELYDWMAAAAERLAAATGRPDVTMAPHGVPLSRRGGLRDADGNELCAATNVAQYPDGSRVAIEMLIDTEHPDCMPAIATLVHEGIHRLAPLARHGGEIFAEKAHFPRIDAVSLQALCDEFQCNEFVPESH